MALPYSFVSGDIARSAEVNANFDYLMDLLGGGSTPGRLVPPGEFLVGERNNVLFTGAADTGATANRFYQIGYNADFNLVSGNWRFDRFISGEPAMAMRIGQDGWSLYTTSATTGDLNAQMTKVVAAKATTGEDYLYVKADVRITQYDGAPRTIEDCRLTFCKMATPPMIYDNVYLEKNTVVKQATDFGVPSYAKAITIGAWITATNASGAGMKFYQERADRSLRHGGIVHAALGDQYGPDPLGQRAGGQIFVPLGEGAYAGQFVIERTAPFDNAYVYVLGYWL